MPTCLEKIQKIDKFNLDNHLRKYNIEKLTKEQAREMEGYLSIDKLGITLRNTKIIKLLVWMDFYLNF